MNCKICNIKNNNDICKNCYDEYIKCYYCKNKCIMSIIEKHEPNKIINVCFECYKFISNE